MLSLVSFVGVDADTDLTQLSKLNILKSSVNRDTYKPDAFVLEFGLLYSVGRAGKEPRYPTRDKLLEIANYFKERGIRYSIHLCGREAIEGFLNQTDDIVELCKDADRIQLNLNVDHFNLDTLVLQLRELSQLYTMIIQINKTKQELVDMIIKSNMVNEYAYNFNFLYDASGGFGKSLDTVSPVIPGYFTGYAGGIDPDNAVKIVKKIRAVNRQADKDYDWQYDKFYIDMESGIRTMDIFDLDKCAKIVFKLVMNI